MPLSEKTRIEKGTQIPLLCHDLISVMQWQTTEE